MRVTIYLPDDLAAKVQSRPRLNVSAVCQDALRRALAGYNEAAIEALVDAGFTPDSAVAAIQADDLTQLSHSAPLSVQLPDEDPPDEESSESA